MPTPPAQPQYFDFYGGVFHIPNPCYHLLPGFVWTTAVGNGLFSDPTIWTNATGALGRPPTTGERALVLHNISYDLNSGNALTAVMVAPGATLSWATGTTRLVVDTLGCYPDLGSGRGAIQIGPAFDGGPVPIQWINSLVTIDWADVDPDTTLDPEAYLHGLLGLGRVWVNGAFRTPFVRAAADLTAGLANLTFQTPAQGWQAQDRLYIADSRQLTQAETSPFVAHWEYPSVGAMAGDGLSCSTAALGGLQFDHPCARDGNGVATLRPHVVNLTRNVRFRSGSSSTQWGNIPRRGHAFFTDRADIDIRNAAFLWMGRTQNFGDSHNFGINNSNGTTPGTNQDLRYPVGVHKLIGPLGLPSDLTQPLGSAGNAAQYRIENCVVDNTGAGIRTSWCYNCYSSHWGLWRGNVGIGYDGWGMGCQDGNESNNLFDGNFVSQIQGNANRVDMVRFGTAGEGFAFAAPRNHYVNNVATNVGGGLFASPQYGMSWYFQVWKNNSTLGVPLPDDRTPASKGAYETNQIGTQWEAIQEWDGNEAYGCTRGMEWWWVNAEEEAGHTGGPTVMRNMRIWHCWEMMTFPYPNSQLTIDGALINGDFAQLGQGSNVAAFFKEDYLHDRFEIKNSTIQGCASGIYCSSRCLGEYKVTNCYFRNGSGVDAEDIWENGGDSSTFHTRLVRVKGCRHDPLPGQTTPNAVNKYKPPDSELIQKNTNIVLSNRVLVEDYQGVVGRNYEVYNAGQAANAILVQSQNLLTACPAAGLTNAQAFAQFGKALYGEVMPASVTTVAGISDFVLATGTPPPPPPPSVVVNRRQLSPTTRVGSRQPGGALACY